MVFVVMVAMSQGASAVQNHEDKRAEQLAHALAGRWNLTATITESSASPVRFAVTMGCRPTALGAAADCTFSARLPGAGPMEASAVIGYNADDGRVYWMEISSAGEFHAHRGQWSGDTIEFEPLQFTSHAATSVEHLTLTLPSDGALLLKSTTTTGATSSALEVKGKRQAQTR